MRTLPTLLVFLVACTAGPSPDERQESALLGTWVADYEGMGVQVRYAPDGTWRGFARIEGQRYHTSGTWRVEDGVIVNTTLAADPIPGMEDIELPYVSREKIVSIGADEYRYVCPVQQCTNTMRRLPE